MELLTPLELSRILKLHPFTVTRLAREGKLPGFKVGGAWRFQKEEFEKWVAEQKKRVARPQARDGAMARSDTSSACRALRARR